ncbi:alpha/beta hydrolase fold domain-containing protein, partial [Mesorhizobium sp. M5C.F.Ca.IN.020.32.2.1]|uniref:alpha/beta hydrolase fold domain-containing protein n=1 Tax=Mesorhizobium sp. M5C.F.Ca.IN.020.32.2.1 TaxID=2496771 RepID=UPI000FD54BC3
MTAYQLSVSPNPGPVVLSAQPQSLLTSLPSRSGFFLTNKSHIILHPVTEKVMTRDPRLNCEMAETKARYEALQLSDGGAPKTLVENRAQQARLLQYWCEEAPDIAGKADLIVPTRHGPIEARLFVPTNTESGPVAIFLHGGGWARGSTANGEWACQAIANEARLRVLSLNYSLAPENPFPTA